MGLFWQLVVSAGSCPRFPANFYCDSPIFLVALLGTPGGRGFVFAFTRHTKGHDQFATTLHQIHTWHSLNGLTEVHLSSISLKISAFSYNSSIIYFILVWVLCPLLSSTKLSPLELP